MVSAEPELPEVCDMLTVYVPEPPRPVPKLTTVVPAAMLAPLNIGRFDETLDAGYGAGLAFTVNVVPEMYPENDTMKGVSRVEYVSPLRTQVEQFVTLS